MSCRCLVRYARHHRAWTCGFGCRLQARNRMYSFMVLEVIRRNGATRKKKWVPAVVARTRHCTPGPPRGTTLQFLVAEWVILYSEAERELNKYKNFLTGRTPGRAGRTRTTKHSPLCWRRSSLFRTRTEMNLLLKFLRALTGVTRVDCDSTTIVVFIRVSG